MNEQHGPWTILHRRLVYTNPWLRVQEDQVLRPDGEPGIFATVTMDEGVVVLPLDEEGRVHLVRQFRYAIGRESVEAIAGGMEPDEAPLAAAQREACEEWGIEAAEWIALGQVDPLTSKLYGPCHLFLARGLTVKEPAQEGTETIQRVTLPLAEAVQQVLASEISHAASALLLLKAWWHLQGEAGD